MSSGGFLAGLIFLVVAGMILGAYWLLILQPEAREKSALRKRLKTESRSKPQVTGGLLKEAQRLSEVHALDTVLRRVEGMTPPLQKLIDQSGVRTNVGGVLLACGALGAAAVIIVTLMSRWWIGLPAGVLLSFAPIFYLRFKRNRRVSKFEEQFPEAIDLIARALRAGHAFTTGLSMVAEEIADPVGTEFRLLYERQNFGMPLPSAMREFADRVPVLDAKFFATAVLTQRESGGNLAEVLDNLSSVIRERFRVKRQVRVISAHGRMTGWVLALLPPALAVAFMVMSPGHVDMLLNDVLGIQMIVAAVTLQVVGTLIIRRIVRIDTNMTPDLLITLAAVFVSVAMLTGALVSIVLAREAPEQRRLRTVAAGFPAATGLIAAPTSLTEAPSDLANRLASFIPKSPKEMSRLQRRFARAGYHGYMPAIIYAACELVLPIVLGSAVLWLAGFGRGLFFALLAAAVGFMAPSFWLENEINKRKKQIENGLPDALDLFIVCLEAGSGLDQAIIKATEELSISHPSLSEELRMITSEIRAGKPRLDAFKNFAERTKVEDVRSLVAMLIQTDRFGTSVSQALRTHAEVSRTKRRQRAEERGAKVGVKLVFPLVLCLFPAFYVVTLGPAIIQFVRVFFGQIANR